MRIVALVAVALVAGAAILLGPSLDPPGAPASAPPPPPCVDLRLDLADETVVAGEGTTITLTIVNCGADRLPIARSGLCGRGPRLWVDDGWNLYEAYPGEAPYRRVHTISMGGCVREIMEPIIRTNLSPGGKDVLAFPWTGRFVVHDLCEQGASESGAAGLVGCRRNEHARIGDHRLRVSWGNATATVTLAVLAPENATFQTPPPEATRDPAQPLRFDPALPMPLARDANGTLARSATPFVCKDEPESTCFGQAPAWPCAAEPRPGARLDADGDKILDAFGAHLASLGPEARAYALVGTDCAVTWSEIMEIRASVGWFPVNWVGRSEGFSADLTRAQAGAIAAREGVRVVEGALIHPT